MDKHSTNAHINIRAYIVLSRPLFCSHSFSASFLLVCSNPCLKFWRNDYGEVREPIHFGTSEVLMARIICIFNPETLNVAYIEVRIDSREMG